MRDTIVMTSAQNAQTGDGVEHLISTFAVVNCAHCGNKLPQAEIRNEAACLCIAIPRGTTNSSGKLQKVRHALQIDETIVVNGRKLVLRAAVVHIGTGTLSGHYIAYLFPKDSCIAIIVDDSKVTSVSRSGVLQRIATDVVLLFFHVPRECIIDF
jgi:hypothetical protein